MGYEKGQSKIFRITLLIDVYSVKNVTQFIEFEDQVYIDKSMGCGADNFFVTIN